MEYLYRFLTANQGPGPAAVVTDLSQVQPGDIIQLSFDGETFAHSPVVVAVGDPPSPSNILVATHSFDADNRPLNTYVYRDLRVLHITHVNL